MPRVSQEHLDARRQQIIDAAHRCFVRHGFHGTSIQHLLAEAGLSAGAVYRYFDSKEDIIKAVASQNLNRLAQAALADVDPADPPPPAELLARVLSALYSLRRASDFVSLPIEIWAEAQRNPAMTRVFQHAIGQLNETLGPIVEVYKERGHIPGDVPAEDVVRVILAQLQGFILQTSLLDVRPETFLRGLDALLGAFEATGRPAAFAASSTGPAGPTGPAEPSVSESDAASPPVTGSPVSGSCRR